MPRPVAAHCRSPQTAPDRTHAPCQILLLFPRIQPAGRACHIENRSASFTLELTPPGGIPKRSGNGFRANSSQDMRASSRPRGAPIPSCIPPRKSSTCRSATAPAVLTPRMMIFPNCFRRLHVLETFNRALVANVASVERGGRLEEQQVHLPLGNRLVLHTPRYDEKLAFVDANIAVAQPHEQLALDHEE